MKHDIHEVYKNAEIFLPYQYNDASKIRKVDGKSCCQEIDNVKASTNNRIHKFSFYQVII